MEFDIVLLLFGTGMLAGMIDAIAGGGGLITLPVLLFIGLGPTEALATNKLQGSFGTFSASLFFVRKGLVKLSQVRFLILCTFLGSAGGTLLVQYTDPGVLNRIIPLLLIATALYFLFARPVNEESRRQRIGYPLFALSIGFGVGFYDGFFGPGAGTFFAVSGVLLMGFNLIETTAHTKVLNFTSNFASLILFALAGHVLWQLGLVMAAGQLFGAHIGARLVLKNGSRLIRPLIVTVTILISLKLLLQ